MSETSETFRNLVFKKYFNRALSQGNALLLQHATYGQKNNMIMKYGGLILEKKEYELLKRILAMSKYYKDSSYRASISKLSEELKSAKIVPEKELPDDVVRFGSIVSIQTPFGPEKSYQLVLPDQSDVHKNKISILAPMGSALIGYAKDDEVSWQFPSGLNVIKIVNVTQEKIETPK